MAPAKTYQGPLLTLQLYGLLCSVPQKHSWIFFNNKQFASVDIAVFSLDISF